MLKDEYKVYEEKMKKSIESVMSDFDTVRAGRANASVLNRISVDYYGTPTPIQQIGSIGSPDPRTLVITPWDASILKGIEKAIQESDLGINPQNDGKCIRLAFPQLTEERRKELVKQIHKYAENGKVAVRNIRRDAMDNFKKQQKGVRDHRGRAEDRREGPAEADRRQLQGDRQDPGQQGKGIDVCLMGLFTKKTPHTAGEVDRSRTSPPYRCYYGRQRPLGEKTRPAPHGGAQGGGRGVPRHRHLLQGTGSGIPDGIRLFHRELEAARR